MAGEREPVVLLELKRAAGTALHEQLEHGLRDAVRAGRLAPGARLPSSRALAQQLGVSRGVVIEAYSQLTAEGYLAASQGAPTRVAVGPAVERPPVPATELAVRYPYNFDPTAPDLAAFPREAWQRSLRAALRAAPFDALGYGDPRGEPVLRNELMAYLGRARGAAPEPEHTLVCGGFTQGFALLCRVLRDRGVERIAVEQPGWPAHALIAERAGLAVTRIPVDQNGLRVAALADEEVVVLTPAHQFPTGAVLAAERRAALLEWAEDVDGLVVEDDYDSELRYDRDAVGALQGLAPERVCSIGSVSKRLAPGIRLGWLLSPSWLTGALTYEQGVGDTPVLDQLALADFLARGELDRHLRRMRLRYRARRETLIGALQQRLPRLPTTGAAAGLFVPVRLGEAAITEAGSHGVGLDPVSGWVPLGFGYLSEPAIKEGVRRLAAAVVAAA
jgi:GntR family transcriptional regulator/MocR family aminotransferase